MSFRYPSRSARFAALGLIAPLASLAAPHEALALVGATPSAESAVYNNVGSPNFTQGAPGCTNTSVSFNSNSFVTCNGSSAWAVQPVQVGTASSAPYTCSSTYEGMIYLNAGTGALSYCDNNNTWETLDSSGQNNSGGYYTATQTATPTSGQGIHGGSTSLGAVFVGYGSIADVTLENHSGTAVFEIPANYLEC